MVTGVCAKRGCWFRMASDREFEDLQFKVTDGVMVFPMEMTGKYAVAEGVVSRVPLDLETTRRVMAHEAEEQGTEIDTWKVPLEDVDRAIADGEDEGFVKVHVKKGSDQILGATVVASHAGELITLFTLAIQHKIGLGAFSNLIYPYPTQGEAIKAAAGSYTRTRLTPTVARVFRGLMRLRR